MKNSTKNIMAIENTAGVFSLAVYAKGKIFQYEGDPRISADKFTEIITFLVAQAEIKITDIEVFLCGTGPGSFTGMRIALSIIKGLVAGRTVSCLGVPSYKALIKQYAPENKPTAIIYDAKKNLVYGAVYRRVKETVECISPEQLFDLDNFLREYCDGDYFYMGEAKHFEGHIAEIYPYAQIMHTNVFPQAKYLIETILEQEFMPSPASEIELLYLFGEDCNVRK